MNYAESSLSEIAIAVPMSTELFRKNRLDFCCGGKQTLVQACLAKNLNLESIVLELRSIDKQEKSLMDDRPLKEITAYIVERYHNDLRRRIPELVALARKVEAVHKDHNDCPVGLSDLLDRLHQEMLMHMMKEENVLFPLIDSGRGAMALMPVKVMTAEHDSHGRELDQIHILTSDFHPPEHACSTWRALYRGLEKFEEELMSHIHLENNILFPRALAQKEGLL